MVSDGSSMEKKKSWFNLVKRFLFSETKSRTEKKNKRRRWVFERLRIKKFASISAPLPSKEKTLVEAEKEHTKHALSLAISSAAAAEAAIAAAQVAAEVVRLTATSNSTLQLETEEEFSINKKGPDTPPSTPQSEREILLYAAVKIQTAFRSYLARKALRALKGIVKLQAIIRGRAVRRQAMTTLKCLQSIVNIQSKVCAQRSFQLVEGTCHCDDETKHLQNFRDKIIRMDSNSQRRWDDSILSKEEAEALYLSKKDAAIKRERIKEYSFTHRNSAESDRNKVSGRWRYWLEQWVDTQLSKSKEFEDLDSKYTSNPSPREEYQGKQPKLKIFQKQCQIEGLDSPIFVPRRPSHHHKRQCSFGDDNNSFSTSPAVPTYMAATESARAKARSMSSPKLRTGSFDTYSDSYSPCKNKLCLISSVSSKVPSSAGRIGKPSGQRSPSLKGIPGAVKSSRVPKDLSFDSECSLANWDRYSAFR